MRQLPARKYEHYQKKLGEVTVFNIYNHNYPQNLYNFFKKRKFFKYYIHGRSPYFDYYLKIFFKLIIKGYSFKFAIKFLKKKIIGKYYQLYIYKKNTSALLPSVHSAHSALQEIKDSKVNKVIDAQETLMLKSEGLKKTSQFVAFSNTEKYASTRNKKNLYLNRETRETRKKLYLVKKLKKYFKFIFIKEQNIKLNNKFLAPRTAPQPIKRKKYFLISHPYLIRKLHIRNNRSAFSRRCRRPKTTSARSGPHTSLFLAQEKLNAKLGSLNKLKKIKKNFLLSKIKAVSASQDASQTDSQTESRADSQADSQDKKVKAINKRNVRKATKLNKVIKNSRKKTNIIANAANVDKAEKDAAYDKAKALLVTAMEAIASDNTTETEVQIALKDASNAVSKAISLAKSLDNPTPADLGTQGSQQLDSNLKTDIVKWISRFNTAYTKKFKLYRKSSSAPAKRLKILKPGFKLNRRLSQNPRVMPIGFNTTDQRPLAHKQNKKFINKNLIQL